jgi:integrase
MASKPRRLRNKWQIRWTDVNGERQSEVHDSFDDAELALGRYQVETKEIRRGLRRLTPKGEPTFAELCKHWLEVRAPMKRSGKTDASFIRVHLLPALGELPLREIGPARIERYKAERAKLSPKTLNLHLTLLGTMLRTAVDLGWLDQVPKIRKPRVVVAQSDFRFLRTREEIERFLIAAREEEPVVFALYAAALFTGMRAGELAGLRWDDVDFERRLITVQRSYNGPTKANTVRHSPILDPLLPELRAWRLQCSGTLVFPTRAGGMRQKSDRAFQETLQRVLDRAGFPSVERNGKRVRAITMHCLRHSFASHWMMNGGDLFRLQRLLGHSSAQMTQRYAHLAPDVFAEDYGRLGSGGLAGSSGADVLPLPEPSRRSV